MSVRVRERKGPGIESRSHPPGDAAVAGNLLLNDVVGTLLPTELSIAVKWMVVRSNPFDRSGRVLWTSWPNCRQTMMIMIAGYML